MHNSTLGISNNSQIPRHASSVLIDFYSFPDSIKKIMLNIAPELQNGIEQWTIFPSSIAYMLYWYERFSKESHKKENIRFTIQEYLKNWWISLTGTIEWITKIKTNWLLWSTEDWLQNWGSIVNQLLSNQELLFPYSYILYAPDLLLILVFFCSFHLFAHLVCLSAEKDLQL